MEAEKMNGIMHDPGGNLYATYGIIGLNTIVFILMAMDGAGIIEANGLVHLKWGSNFGILTLSGDWWRLVTNIFIHFGIIHLAVNMYSLYFAGIYLEPMLGKARYITAYLCTGILASLTSLWWHQTANSAGASGAIFGMYGVFLAFLTSNLIPSGVRNALLKSIGLFVIFNLAYGMKGGIDNAAHVGGLCSGFVIGYIYIGGIRREKNDANVKVQWLIPLIVLVTLSISLFYLKQHKTTNEDRNKLLSELRNAAYKDNEKFIAAYARFVQLENAALEVWKDTTITEAALNIRLKEISLPEWNKATGLLNEMQSFDVSEQLHQRAGILLEYVALRKEEIDVFDDFVANKTNVYRLNSVRTKINKLIEGLE